MATFGRYETIRNLSQTGFTAVYIARSKDIPTKEFAIKVFQSFDQFSENEHAEIASQLFLDSADIQKKLFSAGAQYWAPIYEYGSTIDGSFYVTDRYDRSLQQLIDGHVRLTAKNLHTIITSVVNGLLELKQLCNRPYGNLKPTNILFAGTGDISQIKMALSDPWPTKQLDHDTHYAADLRMVGSLIYLLVTNRPIPVILDGWQVPDSPEWKNFGKPADDWKNLCNRLLNASTHHGTITIETLAEELVQLKAPTPIISSPWLLTAIIAIATIIATISMPSVRTWIANLFGELPPPPDWKLLCEESEDWIENLRQDMANNQQYWYEQDNALTDEIVKKILSKGAASYAVRLAWDTGIGIWEIKVNPSLVSPKKSDTDQALNAIKDIKNFLNYNSNKCWPLLKEVINNAEIFEKRGWQNAGEKINDLVKSVSKPDKQLASNITKILNLKKEVLPSIESRWGNITNYRTKIKERLESGQCPNPDQTNSDFSKMERRTQIEVAKTEDLYELKRNIESLESKYSEIYRTTIPEKEVDEWLAYIKSLPEISSANLNEEWLRRLDKQLIEYVPEQLKKDFNIFLALKEKVEQTRKKLESIENILPPGVDSVKRYVEWNEGLNDLYKNKRKDTFGKIVEWLRPLEQMPDPCSKGFTAKWEDKLNRTKLWHNDLTGLIVAFNQIEQGLNDYYLLDEKLTEKEESINVLYERWEGKNIFADAESILKKAGLTDRIKTLRDIQGSNNVSQLVGIATDEEWETEAVYAAWTRLGQLSWPNMEDDWKTEQVVYEKLKKTFGTHPHEQRKAVLLDNLEKCHLAHEIDYRLITFDKSTATIESLIEEAKRSSLEGNSLATFELATKDFEAAKKKIEEIKLMPSINKYQDTTKTTINDCNDQLREIEKTIKNVIIVFVEWWDKWKTKSLLDSVISKAIRDEWDRRRDEEFAKHIRSDFEKQQNSSVFWLFRDNVKDTYERLQKLDKLLPPSISSEIEQKKAWSIQPSDLYDIKREKLIQEILKQGHVEPSNDELNEISQWTTNLGNLLTDFKQIEAGLNDCYLLTEETGKKSVTLYGNWKNTSIFKEVQDSLKKAKLIDRIEKLIKIETEAEQELIKIAVSPDSQTEAVYAAWTRLGQLSWPNMEDDWKTEQVVYEKLKKTFEIHPHEQRKALLLDNLEKCHLAHEINFRKTELLIAVKTIENSISKLPTNKNGHFSEELEGYKHQISQTFMIPPIEDFTIEPGKIEEQYNTFLNKLIKDPNSLQKRVKRLLKPEYCERLDRLDNGKVIFITNAAGLNNTDLNNFEPVIRNSSSNFEPLVINTWDDFKNDLLKETFFDKTAGGNEKNTGWPKYIHSTKDPSVILKFIPGDSSFYMAIKEITNEQYVEFLNKAEIGAKYSERSMGIYVKNELILDQTYERLINNNGKFYLDAKDDKKNCPVIWITYQGAQQYAKWLGTSLPKDSQYEHALSYSDQKNLHVRSTEWKKLAQEYNKNIKAEFRPLLPLDAIDYINYTNKEQTISETTVVDKSSYNTAWPTASKASGSEGLYDIKGNVFELCEGPDNTPYLFGGSCLSPIGHLGRPFKYKERESQRDIGFRVLVNLY